MLPPLLKGYRFIWLVALAVGLIGATVYFLKHGRTIMGDLYRPHIILARVADVPIGLEGRSRVEVMTGLPIAVGCEIVPPVGEGLQTVFRFTGQGAPVTAEHCGVELTFKGEPGQEAPVKLDYLVRRADGSEQVVDTRRATVALVASREFLKLRALETADQKPLATLTVPQAVIPYAEAALKVEGAPEDYAVLFFVRKVGTRNPVLQIRVPPEDPAGFKPLVAPLKRYRSWGGEVGGFAAWPGGVEPGTGRKPDAIQVGNDDDLRAAFEIYAGLFKAADVGRVTQACISLKQAEPGHAVFTAGDVDLEVLRAMTYKGWLSEPVNVVRAEAAPTQSRSAWRLEH
jgi:hypothetical protein